MLDAAAYGEAWSVAHTSVIIFKQTIFSFMCLVWRLLASWNYLPSLIRSWKRSPLNHCPILFGNGDNFNKWYDKTRNLASTPLNILLLVFTVQIRVNLSYFSQFIVASLFAYMWYICTHISPSHLFSIHPPPSIYIYIYMQTNPPTLTLNHSHSRLSVCVHMYIGEYYIIYISYCVSVCKFFVKLCQTCHIVLYSTIEKSILIFNNQ